MRKFNSRFLPVISIVVVICVLFTGCKDKIPKPKYGIYTYTNSKGITSTIALTKDTIKITNPDFESAKKYYVIQRLMDYNNELADEGRTMTDEEKKEFAKKTLKEADFTRFTDTECNYQVEYFKEDQILNILFCENGQPVKGLFASYYLKDKNIGFADGYYSLQK